MNQIFAFSKTVLSVAVLLLFIFDLTASVKVSRGKIVNGGSFRTIQNSWAVFECLIENPDPRPRKVMIRLRPSDGYSTLMNSNSMETEVPAETSLVFRAPVFVENSEKYDFDVFEDGVRRPNSAEYSCTVKFLTGRQELIGILNDRGNSIGGFNEHPLFTQQLFPVTFYGNTVPDFRTAFQSLRALIVANPDFSKYTAAQYSAIVEYVMNGGILVFADPEGALAASKTPLNVLLPVNPVAVRSISTLEGIDELFPDLRFNGLHGREILFLDSTDAGKPGVTFARHEGFPLYREMNFGLGMVKFLAVSPDRSNFPEDRELSNQLLARICMSNGSSPVYSAFNEPLDKLTGFAVPKVSTVRNLILLYLFALALVILIGIRMKRAGTAWFVSTVVALTTTCLILYYVRHSIGERGSLAAMVQIENRMSPGTADSFTSLYASSATKTDVLSENSRNIFSAIPRKSIYAFSQGDNKDSGFSIASPLELRILPSSSMSIKEMNIAARSSRQFMKSDSPAELSARLPSGFVQPRLVIRQGGFELMPWTAPKGAAVESAFILFPTSSRLLDVSSSGVCTMNSSVGMMTDPLLGSIRNAMEKTGAKNCPALVLVSPIGESGLRLEKTFSLQGKRLTVIPVLVVCPESKITLPNEMLVFSPYDATSRLLLEGNKLKAGFSMQADFSVSLAFSLPSGFAGFRPQSVLLKIAATNTDNVRIVPKLKLKSGNTLVGKSMGGNLYLFSGDKLSELVDPMTNMGVLLIESTLTKQPTKGNQDFAIQTWSLLDLELSLKGTLPENAVRTVN